MQTERESHDERRMIRDRELDEWRFRRDERVERGVRIDAIAASS